MTVITSTNRNSYTGNGTTSVFPFTFRILAATDLEVIKTETATGISTTLALTTDYTVSGVSNVTGSITLVAGALPGGYTLVIRRNTATTQPTRFTTGGLSNNAPALEKSVDRAAMVAQDTKEELGRALKLPITVTGIDAAIPVPQAGRILAWNSAATALENRTDPNAVLPPASLTQQVVGWNSGGTALENKTIDTTAGAVTLPALSRVVPTLTQYLANNAPVNPKDYSVTAIDTGAVNARTAFFNANAAAAGDSRHLQPDKGTYRIDSALTISQPYKPNSGAVLKPASGIALTITGPIEAGHEQIFDLSLGGTISFTGNRFLDGVNAAWWGLDFTGTVDAQPNLQKMLDQVAKYTVCRFPSDSISLKLGATLQYNQKEGVVLQSPADPRQGSSTAPLLFWAGADNGTVLQIWQSQFCRIEGFRIFTRLASLIGGSAALVSIDIDGLTPQIGTACTVQRCYITNGGQKANWVGVRISETVTQNQEYHHVIDNVITSYAELPSTLAVTGTAASPNITLVSGTSVDATAGYFVGARIWIAGAGAAGAPLAASVITVTDSTHLVLNTNVLTTVTAAVATITNSSGAGVKIGNSSNAKRITIRGNQISACKYGIWQKNGSHHGRNSFTGNQINVFVELASEPCLDEGSNTEMSVQHFDYAAGQPMYCTALRADILNTAPGEGYIKTQSGGTVVMKGAAFERALTATAYLLDLAQTRSTFEDFITTTAIPYAQLYKPNQGAPVLARNMVGVTGAPASRHQGEFRSHHGVDLVGAITGINEGYGNTSSYPGVVGRSFGRNGSAANEWRVALQGSPNTGGTDWMNNMNFRAATLEIPSSASGHNALAAEGARVTAPVLTGGSQLSNVKGYVVEDLKGATGVLGTVYAIDILGPADVARFAGPVQPNGITTHGKAIVEKSIALTSGTTPALDASLGNLFTLTVLTNIAAVVAVPTNPPAAGQTQRITVILRNGSGAGLTTAPTFNTGAGGFKLNGAATNMANNTEVPYVFAYDPVQSFWYEIGTHAAAGL